MDVKLDVLKCPQCGSEFKFIAFRNIKSHIQKLDRILGERPNLTIVDFEDYQRQVTANKAHEFLK